MKKRTVINSPKLNELKRRRKRVFLRKIILILLIALLFFSTFFYFTRLSVFNIIYAEVSGNSIVDGLEIKETAEEELEGKYFWVIPKTNILFYPREKIYKRLEEKFPRLKDISLSVNNSKILKVSVEERIGEYIWCGKVPPQKINTNQDCYFLDKDGYLFDRAPFFSGEVYLKFYGETMEKDGEPVPGYFREGSFKGLLIFSSTLIDMGLRPAAINLKDGSDVEIYLSGGSKSPTGPKIIFKSEDNLEKVLENLDAALDTDPLKTKIKTKYSLLQYIDLRYGNKVYFKFSDDGAPLETVE